MPVMVSPRSTSVAVVTAFSVLLGAAIIVPSSLTFSDTQSTNLAAKGDRLSRVIQIACDASTVTDGAPSCSELTQSTTPSTGVLFQTDASTRGQTTILTRRPIPE